MAPHVYQDTFLVFQCPGNKIHVCSIVQIIESSYGLLNYIFKTFKHTTIYQQPFSSIITTDGSKLYAASETVDQYMVRSFSSCIDCAGCRLYTDSEAVEQYSSG
nr:hypothetical protein Iba_chr02bCG18520 [Ipomoea batatas]GMD14098.1 hypothetical protein Iba_chr07bCG3130 [Ipomoea batatas]GMD88988.1 hypothetical protein Iba_chr14cCG12440 [Ipomoea batatas]